MPQTVSILDKVRTKIKTQNVDLSTSQAVQWYRNQISKLGGATRTAILADKSRTRDYFYPGAMYLFVYDPKHKATLPYYDKFPLVFPVDFLNDGFTGLNLHYLDYRSRLALFHNLLDFTNKKTMNERTRMQLSYDLLKSAGTKYKAFKPCFKRYLSKHVMSQAVRIEAQDWETALFLPVENFAKKGKSFVWSESTRIMAGQMHLNLHSENTVRTESTSIIGTSITRPAHEAMRPKE